ncbi:UDP-N-acetylmuramoyl-tripeptide--D-alanyl-D-alanine ligase [Laspinema olomoucense]|uniref:UDP-N-acetylmuramoyl-tripeptide--D-alanyl-D-alanine ligase n=1 Tax=Laspinema olomoucense D3b TaxID=2953688 RepID=A0ABT2N206_9CYAN|nr:UDP-N-acetylmuramoyl-tripeptide--D-alanyl-D-alanine ligase [Laspinema sp. D3b]MCT7976720.1 UDP-N-acetylmuramoyl-tripeptide--D-alanyl-D-alanine ligase [Laspinema sp. D3b]
MSCFVTLAQLLSLLNAQTVNPLSEELGAKQALNIITDTRSLRAGEVFVALRGTQFDGHQFIGAAFDKGAIAAIVDRDYVSPNSDWPLLVVSDTLAAYQAIAHWWRTQFDVPLIGITGSVGKTTTKELISAVLNTQGPVLKTEKNYNNEIGVPKTLLNLTADHDYAVIEMAMRGKGEIALLAEIAAPTIGVITNVGTAHIERLGSEAAIASAKCELLEKMSPEGIAVLNYDNSRLMETAAKVWSGKTLTYGFTGGDLQGTFKEGDFLEVEGITFPVPLPGEHNALNYLAALAVAKLLNVSWEPLKAGLAVELPDGRARRYELAHDIVILDETYNAGLESMTAALQMLAQTKGERQIAVLGTMKELGERSLEFHQRIGSIAKSLNLDALFIFADPAEAAAMAKGATGLPFVEIIDIEQPNAHDYLCQRVKDWAKKGDRILFKASHSVQLDRVVEKFRAG